MRKKPVSPKEPEFLPMSVIVEAYAINRSRNLSALRRDLRERDSFCGDGYSHSTGAWASHGFNRGTQDLGPVASVDLEEGEAGDE